MDYIIKQSPSAVEMLEGWRKGHILNFKVEESVSHEEKDLFLVLTGLGYADQQPIDRNFWEIKGFVCDKDEQAFTGELYITPVPGNALGSLIVGKP